MQEIPHDLANDPAEGFDVPRETALPHARATTRWLSYLAAFAIALSAYLAAYDNIRAQLPTGDEPSYVLDAFSMARDGDRDLSNQYSAERPKPLEDLFGIAAFPHVYKLTNAGEISWHGAGLAFALVPGVWIGDKLDDPLAWARLELVLIDALAALALFVLLRRLGEVLRVRQAIVWVVWATTALSLPLVAYGDQFYPEVLALLCVLVAMNAAARPAPGWRALLIGSIAASYLPWLHIRFIPICFGLLAALAIRGLGTHLPSRQAAGRIAAASAEARALVGALISRRGATIGAAVLLPAIASFLLMAIEFQHWYGSPDWTAVGGGSGAPAVSVNTWYPAVLGGLLGTDYGWIPWAPVAALGLAAIGCLWLVSPRWTTFALLVAGLYQAELALSGIATPGFVYPGRYEIVCVPLLAIPLLLVLARIPLSWIAFVPLAAAGLAVSYDASQNSGRLLLNTGTVALPAAAHLQSAFPDIENPPSVSSFIAEPAAQDGLVGRLSANRKVRVATPADKGILTAGPRATLTAGAFVARFSVSQTGGAGRARIVELQAWTVPNITLGSRTLSAADLPAGRAVNVSIPFATPGGIPIETRAIVYGRATVRVGGTRADPVSLSPSPLADTYPSGALMAAWLGGLTFIGALLVSVMRARRRVPQTPTRFETRAGRLT